MAFHARQFLTVVLAAVLSTSRTHAQQAFSTAASSSGSPDAATNGSSSSSSRLPYACFYNECPTTTPEQDTGPFASCLKSAFPLNTDQKVVWPGSAPYAYASRHVSSQHQRYPAAVVYAHNTADVQAAVKCAYASNVQVTVAGGRHSFEGWSVVTGFMVVDTSNMTQVAIVGREGSVLTAQVGPGNTNALLLSQLHAQGYTSAGAVVGQCPSVGMSGYLLGGGMGDLSRMFGLGCDQLVAVELVTYTGEVVVASSEQHSDLLWASCGGGGGLGIVTQWTVKVHDLGADPVLRIKVASNAESAIPAMLRVQDFILSSQTSLRFSGGVAWVGGFEVYFVGSISTALYMLSEGGLLNPDWLEHSKPSSALQSRAHLNQPPLTLQPSSIPGMPAVGVTVMTFPNYYEAMIQSECESVAAYVPYSISHMVYVTHATSYGLGLRKSCKDISTLNRYKALAAQPASPINTGIGDIWHIFAIYRGCRLLPALNEATWRSLVAVSNDPRCTTKGSGDAQQLLQQLQEDPEGTYYCFALKHVVGKPSWHHLLGGAVSQVAPSASAYPWRNALSPLCFTAVLPSDVYEADGVTFRESYRLELPWLRLRTPDMSPAALVKAIYAVQAAYLGVLYSSLGEDAARAAYTNYQTEQVSDYEAAYWGPNYKRLQQIKAKWDPEGVFSKPFTVQPAHSL